jgi:hypothetical protein
MARFPDDTFGPSIPAGILQPPIPTPRPNVPQLAAIPTPAPAQLIPSGGASPAPQTLAALMARQKALAEQQQGIQSMPAGTIPQGLAMMAQSLVNALQRRKAERQLAEGRQDLSQLMGGINLDTGPTSEQIGQIMTRDPDLAQQLYVGAINARAAAAKQEHWVDIPLPEGAKEGTQWQQNTVTGEKRAVGGAGISINTGQPLPAEVAGRVGLAQGFLNDYENILKEVDAGNLTGANYISSVTFGRGTGGEAYRTIQSGVDSLRRGLSGAGIGVQEAQDYAERYAPVWSDDAATLRSKMGGLRDDLLNVQDAVTQGRKIDLSTLGKREEQAPAPTSTTTPPPDTTAPASTPATTPTPAATKGAPTEAYLKARPAGISEEAWIAEWQNADPTLW